MSKFKGEVLMVVRIVKVEILKKSQKDKGDKGHGISPISDG